MTAPGGVPTVAVVGGGLAGLAAAVALRSAGCQVDLYEARRQLGGRATSFRDPGSDELVDHCQHVSMGCCTNLSDFCRRTHIAGFFRRDCRLHFIAPDGRDYSFSASRWLPAPLHLASGFWGLKFLSMGDRLAIGRAFWKLMRWQPADQDSVEPTVAEWLNRQGQSRTAIEHFWNVILVSALGESLDRASLSAARKVIVDGFLAAREAFVVEVPEAPLGTLYGEKMEQFFSQHQIGLHLQTSLQRLSWQDRPQLELDDGRTLQPDFVVLALPWFKLAAVVSPELAQAWPWLAKITAVEAAPITGIHLWFDRPVTDLPHAVLIGRTSQWIFNRGAARTENAPHGHYYQVVISASRDLTGRDREQVVAEVCQELAAIWPAAAPAKVLSARVVTERSAVFSARPGLDRVRPAQGTATPGILVAGDWTATGWPATMESAVRSGYLAAESIMQTLGRPNRFLVPDLPRGLLARCLIRN